MQGRNALYAGFYDKYQDENVIILAVNMTHLENSMSEVQSFVEKMA